MKTNKLIITVAALTAVSAIALLSTKSLQNSNNAPSENQAKTAAESELYRVAEHNGRIAVFSGHDTQPLYILSSPYFRDLPEYDRLLLKDGITASSNRELLKILEDYDN